MTTHLALLIALVPVVLAQYDFSWAPKYDVTKPPTTAPAQPLWTQYFKQVNPTMSSPDITACNSPNPLVWGATYDDGPSPSTPMVLDYLKLPNVSVKATFWVIGANVQFLPEVLARTLHTWSHSNLSLLSDDQIISELVYSARTVYEVTKAYPKYYRPPYGAIDARVRALANTMGLTAVTWNKDSLDWSYVGKSTLSGMISSVTGSFRTWVASSDPNSISLEHDLYPDTAAAILPSMDILIRAGRVIQTVAQCTGDAAPYENTVLKTFFTNGFFENPATGNGSVASSSSSSIGTALGSSAPSAGVSGSPLSASTTGGSSTPGNSNSGNSVAGSSDGSQSKPLSTGAIVGIAVGCGAAVLVAAGAVLGIRYQKKKKADAAKQTLGEESAYVTAL
ncbi:chitin deacetylase [Chytriomyces hyalinus]|nr:chitin deacetylase [Chytriomyces hyalinus]